MKRSATGHFQHHFEPPDDRVHGELEGLLGLLDVTTFVM